MEIGVQFFCEQKDQLWYLFVIFSKKWNCLHVHFMSSDSTEMSHCFISNDSWSRDEANLIINEINLSLCKIWLGQISLLNLDFDTSTPYEVLWRSFIVQNWKKHENSWISKIKIDISRYNLEATALKIVCNRFCRQIVPLRDFMETFLFNFAKINFTS